MRLAESHFMLTETTTPVTIDIDVENLNYHAQFEYNLLFLRAQQNYLNDRLQVAGVVLLNDVLDSLALPRTQMGAVVGWTRGDYIDLGVASAEALDTGGIRLQVLPRGLVFNEIGK